ncbi:ATP-dependent DNA helicase [Paenibacillus albiflavus]|uniref:ATP-dependent DNA helicase n=1 Tax=Paenibacillus albiflavus TaxID=2545760 RepID=A0A4R4EE60_9BACL|nr:ATP-dependent DNA helicase [Paenibacillus albiflavus]TCZ78296.1 ATP-dependent DNA helicase [Paenibacillus albiflavus]
MISQVQIAVRSLVEYVYLAGSIDSGFRSASSLTEGTKAHQKVQKQYSEQDQKEVYVKAEIVHGDLLFVIDGRCDGILEQDGMTTIDEIKSTMLDMEQITADRYPVHWAQAKCYAYMYAEANGLGEIKVQLTYYQIETEETKRFVEQYSRVELASFVTDVIMRYAPYAAMLVQHKQLRDKSAQEIPFPFDNYRAGQRMMAGAVYRTIEEGMKLFAKAPTGIGKTISTLFPSIKAMGQGLVKQLFYLTARTITRTSAEEALVLMQSKGLHLHAVTLTAKDKICFQEEVRCQKDACEFADGYYDRINEAVLDILSNETLMTRPTIEQYARKHRVCPFEFSLDIAYAADTVICDYNYVFDPRISLKRMYAEKKGQTVLLVDEAHNLVDRAREMFSASINKSDYLAMQREFKTSNSALSKAAKVVNDYFIAMRKEMNDSYHVTKEIPEQLVLLIEEFVLHAEKELVISGGVNALLLEVYFAAQSFLRISKLYDERYVTYAENSRNEVQLKLLCLDPSYLLQQMGKGYRSHIYFSATLSPMSFYRDMLGACADDYTVSIPTPFAKEQLDVSVVPLSTRYQDRELTKAPLARMLHELVHKRKGNYLFFFPSYAYMNLVYESFTEEGTSVSTIIQQVNMTEEEREQFLAAFSSDNQETFVGFAVMGGIFSEGIDLVGDRLTGVVVVGVGLPQLGVERNIMKQYYDRTGKNGYDYAYVFPGMNKVLQAGGRLIRSEQDTGLLVLVDDRYLHASYQRLLPEEWSGYTVME